ncbi:MAG: hypothetical protein AAGF84_10860 [Planctomycetota bacterium]
MTIPSAARQSLALFSVFAITFLGIPAGALNPSVGDERYVEAGFGFSIPMPVGATLDPHPQDGSVVAWDLGDRASVRLRIKRSEQKMIDSLEPMVEVMWAVSGYGLSTSRPAALKIDKRRIAGQPGLIHIVKLEPEVPLYLDERRRAEFDTRPLFFGQALVLLGPFSVAAIDVYAPYEQKEAAEALLNSLADDALLTEWPDLHDQRKAAFESGAAWLEDVDLKSLVSERPEDAWFEVRRDNAVVGYARDRRWTDADDVSRREVALPEPGFVTARYTSTMRENTRLTTRHEAYHSSAVDKEVWSSVSSLTTTVQQGGGVFEDQRFKSEWTETAVRNGGEISLVFETPPDSATVRDVFEGEWVRAMQELKQGTGPGKINRNLIESQVRTAFVEIPSRLPRSRIDGEDPIPPTELYLSQAVLPVVPRALAGETPGRYAFYAYDAEAGRLAMRTFTVEPGQRDSTVVVEQPTPWSPTTTYRFDSRGNLISMVRPGGTEWVPTTKEALARQFPELR